MVLESEAYEVLPGANEPVMIKSQDISKSKNQIRITKVTPPCNLVNLSSIYLT